MYLSTPRERLLAAATAALLLQLTLSAVAIAANLPAQFGEVGTDAAAEYLARGTALSAPLLPLLLLTVSIGALAHGGRLTGPGAAGVGLVAVVTLVGALGEAFAPATPDVAKNVLVASGVIGTAVATTLLALVAPVLPRPRLVRSVS